MKDLHSHILYGLDDGAETRAESVAMLRAARAAGVTEIVATPHVRNSRCDFALAQSRCAEVSALARDAGIALKLGFELFWDVACALPPEAVRAYCFSGERTLLLEFHMSADEPPMEMRRVLTNLQRADMQIVIAHPERYRFVQKDADIAVYWKDSGCLLQMDADVLTHSLFSASRRAGETLLRRGLYDFYASDAHCAADYEAFARAIRRIRSR